MATNSTVKEVVNRLVSVMLLTWIAQAPIANAALLSLQPDITYAENGDSISLDLVVSGLGDFGPDSLAAFDIDVGFDPLALSFMGSSLGSLLGNIGLAEALDAGFGDSGGSVNVAEVSYLLPSVLDALQTSNFVLASLNFHVLDLAAGDTTSVFIFPGLQLVNGGGQFINVTDTRSASIQGRASVPVPGTLLLCMVSLLGLLLAKRRRYSAGIVSR